MALWEIFVHVLFLTQCSVFDSKVIQPVQKQKSSGCFNSHRCSWSFSAVSHSVSADVIITRRLCDVAELGKYMTQREGGSTQTSRNCRKFLIQYRTSIDTVRICHALIHADWFNMCYTIFYCRDVWPNVPQGHGFWHRPIRKSKHVASKRDGLLTFS